MTPPGQRNVLTGGVLLLVGRGLDLLSPEIRIKGKGSLSHLQPY